MSRISTAQMYNTAQGHVAQAREREVASAEKAATNKEIVRPSQNPTGWVQAANLKDELSQAENISKNANIASRCLGMTDTILGQVQELISRAHEITIPAASDSAGTFETRQAVLAEVKTLNDHLLRSLNTRYGGRTLFGGFQTMGPAFDKDGEYLGDNGQFRVEVSKNLIVPLNVDVRKTIHGEDVPGGVNIINTFRKLVFGLEQNNNLAIRECLPDLLRGVEQLSVGRAQVGARMSEIDRALSSAAIERIESLDNISKIEEADAIKTFSDLTRDQTVLKAAISTSQKILNEDPVNTLFK